MKIRHYKQVIVGLLCLFVAMAAYAESAQLLLFPTRIIMEGKARYATITVKNTGDATGRYRITLVDTIMQENGAVKMLDEDERDAFSAQDMLRISPRSMTLAPGEYQNVRILAKKPKDLEDGEYRSHVKVKMTENNLDEVLSATPDTQTKIAIKPKLVMVVPLIVRHGADLAYGVSISKAVLRPPAAGQKQPVLDLTFSWEGNRSTMGDIRVTHISGSGKESLLKYHPGIAIYRGTGRRDLSLPLEVPAGVGLKGGTLRITYTAQEKEGNAPIASKDVPL